MTRKHRYTHGDRVRWRDKDAVFIRHAGTFGSSAVIMPSGALRKTTVRIKNITPVDAPRLAPRVESSAVELHNRGDEGLYYVILCQVCSRTVEVRARGEPGLRSHDYNECDCGYKWSVNVTAVGTIEEVS